MAYAIGQNNGPARLHDKSLELTLQLAASETKF